MSLQVELKKSAVSQKLPFPSDLALGEIALNYNADGVFLTCKDTAGNIRKVTGVWVAATAPTSPTKGDPWLDTSSSTHVLKIYNGTSWSSAATVPLATTSVYGTVQLATSADITNGTSGKVVDAAQLQSKITAELSATPITFQQVQVVGNTTIGGNLTVNGTTTTINTQDLLVEDKNIIIGNVDTPSDVTADSGGITLKGTTDKTINWVDATDSWTSSEHVDLASGKSYRINGTEVLSATALGSAVQISSANIPNGTIVDADVNASAEIAVSKLADGDARQLLQTDAAGTGVEWTSNVDVPGTLDVTGATTLDSTLTVPAGSEAAPTVRFTGDTNTGIYSPGADQLALSTNGTGRLFVDSNGRVFAGLLTSPTSLNDGAGSTFTPSLYATTTSGVAGVAAYVEDGVNNRRAGLFVDQTNAIWGLSARWTSGEPVFVIRSGVNERLRITSAGLVGIGTSSPSKKFVVKAATSGEGLGIIKEADGSTLSATIEATRDSTDNSGINAFEATTTDGNCFNVNYAGGAYFKGNVGIGTTSPGASLEVAGSAFANIFLTDTTASATGAIYGDGGSVDIRANNSTNDRLLVAAGRLSFDVSGSERARIDSSGRLLVGTSSSFGGNCLLQVVSSGANAVEFARQFNDPTGPRVILTKTRGTPASIVLSGDVVSEFLFKASDGTDTESIAARIAAEVDGTPGADDMPGRLVFSVTADGASSPTEAMRIKNSRILNFANTPVYADNAAAKTGGLVNGDVYRKSDGTLMIVYT